MSQSLEWRTASATLSHNSPLFKRFSLTKRDNRILREKGQASTKSHWCPLYNRKCPSMRTTTIRLSKRDAMMRGIIWPSMVTVQSSTLIMIRSDRFSRWEVLQPVLPTSLSLPLKKAPLHWCSCRLLPSSLLPSVSTRSPLTRVNPSVQQLSPPLRTFSPHSSHRSYPKTAAAVVHQWIWSLLPIEHVAAL
jgi:hypothetical protein